MKRETSWGESGMAASREAAGGTFTDLNELVPSNSGWELRQALDINDRGEIAGLGLWRGELAGFVLTPLRRGSK